MNVMELTALYWVVAIIHLLVYVGVYTYYLTRNPVEDADALVILFFVGLSVFWPICTPLVLSYLLCSLVAKLLNKVLGR